MLTAFQWIFTKCPSNCIRENPPVLTSPHMAQLHPRLLRFRQGQAVPILERELSMSAVRPVQERYLACGRKGVRQCRLPGRGCLLESRG